MKYIIPTLIALAMLAPAVSEAACGRLGWRPLQNAAQRRAEGRGIGQKNGPAKRLARGTR